MRQFRIVLGIFAIIFFLLEIYILFFDDNFYPMEFFLLSQLFVIGFLITSSILIHYSKFKNRKYLRHYLATIMIFSFVIIILKNRSLNQKLEKVGIEITGKVIDKRPSKNDYTVYSEFIFRGNKYNSELRIQDRKSYKKVNIGDKMLIKFEKQNPKNNRGIRLLKYQNTIK